MEGRKAGQSMLLHSCMKTSKTKSGRRKKRETIHAVVAQLYENEEEWKEGMGDNPCCCCTVKLYENEEEW